MKSIIHAKHIPANTSGIYLIKSPSGETYIGQSICLKKRLIDHKCPSRKYRGHPISIEFLKYNFEDFQFKVLQICDRSELNEMESYWIGLMKPSLNISTGGHGATGHKVSSEVKEKLRLSGRSQWDRKTEDERNKIIKFNLTGRKSGFSHSDEVREKIRKTLTGRKQDQNVVRKRAESMKSAMVGNSNGNKGVVLIQGNGEFKEFDSIKEAALFVGVHPSGISKAVKSEKTCAGFNWKLKDI